MSRTSDEPGQLDGPKRPPGDATRPPATPPAEARRPPGDPPPVPPGEDDKRQPGLLAVVRETVVLVVLAVLLAVVFKTFLVAAFYIPSGSMESTLNVSDRVLVEKVSYRFGEVQNGDVIVFVHDDLGLPANGSSNPVARFFTSLGQAIGLVPPSDRDFIKRVVGVPGDEITCDGALVRNGRRVEEPYLDPGVSTEGCKPVTVKPGELYVMGDNRSNSQDSRSFGPIDRSDVVGRAFVRIWPFTHVGWLRRDR
jgi:signal peptidase I